MASAKNAEKNTASSNTKASAAKQTKSGAVSKKASKNQIITKSELKEKILNIIDKEFDTSPDEVSDKVFYETLSRIVVELMQEKHKKFMNNVNSEGKKQVYYLSMEFLMGRSLKTSLYNLDIINEATEVMKDFGVNINNLFECEPDAGLGNGGLGRLAACYLDGLATQGYAATGYSICYEYGIFKQKLEDGWQTELPDNWLPGGNCWLVRRNNRQVEIHFDGDLKEYWDNQYHCVTHENYTTVIAVPYDLYVSGYDSDAVSRLRLWRAESPSFDMGMFNSGEYGKALGQNAMAQAISKVLYPNDNHAEGKSLRLRQQYFMCAASIADIVDRHMRTYGTLDNLHEKVAIHINDTHPTLAIPELMRIMLDDCGFSWNKAWHIVTNTFAYTNHTVMAEALEKWDCNLLKQVTPRIFSIIVEINERYCRDLMERYDNESLVTRMSIINNNLVKMANLCVHACHSVNGVSKIHSEIVKNTVFHDEYVDCPNKFKNVTNGIAYRRWLYQSNPGLTNLLREKIGSDFLKNGAMLKKLEVFKDDKAVLDSLAKIKKQNKNNFAKYVKSKYGITLNTDSIFDVQVKRLHEYKRQHLNALNIIAQYNYLLENPNADFVPKTYIFAAKAAPGYYLAKQIIKLIWSIGEELKKNPQINEKLSVIFLEDYCVTLSEMLMPAAEISEQISLAGTEASGTGNMKLMLNGAVTLGTMDGANVEICEQVGKENIITFGMSSDEVTARKSSYHPEKYYNEDGIIRASIDKLYGGVNGNTFEEVANSLKNSDPYMVLADFEDYQRAQAYASECYKDQTKWQKMSLENIACAGVFSADRAVEDYARDIWGLIK